MSVTIYASEQQSILDNAAVLLRGMPGGCADSVTFWRQDMTDGQGLVYRENVLWIRVSRERGGILHENQSPVFA